MYRSCFVPLYEEVRRKADRNRILFRRLFPGYIFIDTDHPEEVFERLKEMKEFLKASGRQTYTAVNVGMENEALYRTAEEIPEDAGYFSLIITKMPDGDSAENGS